MTTAMQAGHLADAEQHDDGDEIDEARHRLHDVEDRIDDRLQRSERAIRMPIGMPMTIESRVQTVMMDRVRIVSSHMPKKPIRIIATKVPMVILIERLEIQTMATMARSTIHQGVCSSSCSNHRRKSSSGRKKFSIESPQARENSR